MSSALPAATLPSASTSSTRDDALAARERMRDGAADVSGADDADGRP